MALSRLYSIIGDSNVRRNMTGMNIASREAMKHAQVIDCSSMARIDDALNEIRAESEVLIFASVTELLLSSGDCGTIFSSIDPVLTSLASRLTSFCSFRPTLQACVSEINLIY